MVEVRMSRREAMETLGLREEDARNEETVRSAYRRLALQHHPDRNGSSSESTATFQRIASAYQRLTGPDAALDDGPEGAVALAVRVDAVQLYNTLVATFTCGTNPLAAAMLLLSAAAGQQHRMSSEALDRALAEDAAGRAEMRRVRELGFTSNSHPVAALLRTADDSSALAALLDGSYVAGRTDLGLGNTVAHFACYFGREKCVLWLAEHCDGGLRAVVLDPTNTDGLSPLDLARRQCHFSLVERLELETGLRTRDPAPIPRCRFFHPPSEDDDDDDVDTERLRRLQRMTSIAPRTEEDIARERVEMECRIRETRAAQEHRIALLHEQLHQQETSSRLAADPMPTTAEAAKEEDTQPAWMKELEAALERSSASVEEHCSRL